MGECFRCGLDTTETDGCTEDRRITFTDGEETEPIPYGDADWDLTYQETVEDYERQIENGGRGNLGPEHLRQELEEFKQRWDSEEFNNRVCHDCGVKPGEYHHPGCDSEKCPRCGEQYFICDCHTSEKERIW